MTTSRISLLAILALLTTTMSSCSIAGGIFKGGIWVGAIIVFLVVAIIWWLVSKMGGGSNTPS